SSARDLDGLAHVLGVAPRRLGKLCDVLVLEGVLARARDGRLSVPAPPPETTGVLGGMWREIAACVRADAPIPLEVLYDARAPVDARVMPTSIAGSRELWASEIAAGLAPDAALVDAGGRGAGDTVAWLETGSARRATLVTPAAWAQWTRDHLASYGERAAVV